MRKTDKIGFEDIFDLTNIEKVFESSRGRHLKTYGTMGK